MNPIIENAYHILKNAVECGAESVSSSWIRKNTRLSDQAIADSIAYLKDVGAIEVDDTLGVLLDESGFDSLKVLPKGRFIYHESVNPKIVKKPVTLSGCSERDLWKEIEVEFHVSRGVFSRKIWFIPASYEKNAIIRDIAHAYGCIKSGFYKSALILAGSVIEEMLRQFLKYKKINVRDNKFAAYTIACEEHRLLKRSVSQLADVIRNFRNLVHLEKEPSKKYAISKSTAFGAFHSIFTVANDFAE